MPKTYVWARPRLRATSKDAFEPAELLAGWIRFCGSEANWHMSQVEIHPQTLEAPRASGLEEPAGPYCGFGGGASRLAVVTREACPHCGLINGHRYPCGEER